MGRSHAGSALSAGQRHARHFPASVLVVPLLVRVKKGLVEARASYEFIAAGQTASATQSAARRGESIHALDCEDS